MSETLKFTQKFSMDLADGTTFTLGDEFTPLELSVTNGYKYETLAVVADDYGSEVLWATGDGGMDTFEVALIYSDADVWIELRNEQETDEFTLIELQAGVWHVLTSDNMGAYQTTTRIDGEVLANNTDYGQIDQITATRDVADGQGDAQVRIILFN